MELLYVYARKYRLFQDQEFLFSDRFLVDYDPGTGRLDIRENPDYFDIYPANIRGVTAVVGRNASGKTSLLSLIGDKPEDRAREGESYFLLYYWGKGSQGNLFLLETNDSRGYLSSLNDIDMTQTAQKIYTGLDQILLLGAEDGSWCPLPLGDDTTRGYGILSFRQEGGKLDEELDQPGVRRYGRMQTDALYDVVSLLEDSTSTEGSDPGLYQAGDYRVYIRYASSFRARTPLRGFWEEQSGAIYQNLDSLGKKIVETVKEKRLRDEALEDLLILDMLRSHMYLLLKACLGLLFGHTRERNWADLMKQYAVWDSDPFDPAAIRDRLLILARKLVDENRIAGLDRFHQAHISVLREFLDRCRISASIDWKKKKINYEIVYTVEQGARKPDRESAARRNRMVEIQNNPAFRENLTWEIRWLSCGEKENLAMFSSLNTQLNAKEWYDLDFMEEIIETNHMDVVKRQSFLLLFDEIERSMHPNMCRCLLENLMKFLSRYRDKEFQIVVASHSPFLLGDLRRQNVICLEGGGGVRPRDRQPESFGQNIHTLLKDQFFLDNTFSEYAAGLIGLVSDCLELESLEEMRRTIREKLGVGFSDKRLPANDGETRQFLRSVIGSIGEPLIRRSLEEKLDLWHPPARADRQTRLEWYRQKVRELEQEAAQDD